MNTVSRMVARAGAALVIALMAGCSAVALPADEAGTPTGAVLSFHEAWDTNNCELFESVTTAGYRRDLGPGDCDDFAASVAEQADWGWQVEITDESSTDDTARVSTTETWTESDGVEQTQVFLYELVLVNDAWVIDNLR